MSEQQLPMDSRTKVMIVMNMLFLGALTVIMWRNTTSQLVNTSSSDCSYSTNLPHISVINDKSLVIAKYYYPPSKDKLKLSKPNVYDHSQLGQGSMLNKMYFKNKTGGFFLEVGAHDGESLSNTLMFERFLGWTGILVEANPSRFKTLLSKNRKSHMFNLCLGRSGTSVRLSGKTIPCVSIKEIFNFLRVTHIDYVVLDVENDKDFLEPEILANMDFAKVTFGLFQIEIGWFRGNVIAADGSLTRVDKGAASLKELERYFFARRYMKLQGFEIKAFSSFDLIFGHINGPYLRQDGITV